MPGVRMHHPTLRGATFVFEIPDWPYPGGAFACSACERYHTHKAVHLRLDSVGDVIVAEETFDKIRPMVEAAGFKVLNQIYKPPPLVVGMFPTAEREADRIVRMED